MLIAAFLTCPCHLIIVVPLLVASGSALGLFLDRHFIFMLIVFSGAFIASLTMGMKCLGNSGLDS